jgi:methanogenic corrinoid protein MtbC1
VVLGSSSLRFVDSTPGELAAVVRGRLRVPPGAVEELLVLRLQALDVAVSLRSPELLADQRSWEAARLEATAPGVAVAEVDQAVLEVLSERLGLQQAAEIDELTTRSAALAPEELEEGDRLPAAARAYLELGLAGRRDAALAVVTEARATGLESTEIMLSILQPAQVELGQLWEADKISVAEEHLVTALTHQCLGMLFSTIPRQRTAHTSQLVALTVGSETHELGIRMVAELFQHTGWNTSYLGADIPHRDVVTFVAARKPHVLAVSATMVGHVHAVSDLVAQVRAEPRCADVRVLVGGHPFVVNPRLAEFVGADGWAPDPREALALCQSWMRSGAAPGEA